MARRHSYLNGHETSEAKNILEPCLSLGYDLPYFCWLPAMGSVGSCRQCAVLKYEDADDEQGQLIMSCMEPVKEETFISIEKDRAKDFRRQIVESLMLNHPHDCPTCDEGGECHLQDMTVMAGHNYRRNRFNKRTYRNQYLGPFINHEMNRCIQCYRCVRFYKDYAGGDDLEVLGPHSHLYFGRREEGTLQSEFSGNLAEVCPTGVFTDKTLKQHYTRKWDLTTAPSVCHQCSLGCNIIAGERYGTLRRIRSRYNGDVNGYFICDRGRFGYQFVNSENRPRQCQVQEEGNWESLAPEEGVEKAASWIRDSKVVIGIGSPRAPLESNFALQQLVGTENFYSGMSRKDHELTQLALEKLQKLPVRSPSLKEIEKCDAVLVLGEDLTNTAPMMALALRQALRRKHFDIAKKMGINEWDDFAVREAAQDNRSPLFLAMPYATKLDEIAEAVFRNAPREIARLGYAVAARLDEEAPPVEGLSQAADELASQIAEVLSEAERPLIIAGTSLQDRHLIAAAGNVAFALSKKKEKPRLAYVLPEANAAGQILLNARPPEHIPEGATLVLLENDLFRRMPAPEAIRLLGNAGRVIALDHTRHASLEQAGLVFPAGAFAESDGTLVNNEGRAQRFYQVYVPGFDIRESWRWLKLIGAALGQEPFQEWNSLAGITASLAAEKAVFQGIDTLTPGPDFRIAGQKIPRQPHRYSGRTAMHADQSVDEPTPPADPDSPLSFSMEGYFGEPPSSVIPFFWSPGWNSEQSINKYQIEVGGALHDGDPGRRLIAPASPEGNYEQDVPPVWSPKEKHTALPIHHIFGSEETSARGDAVQERSPELYVALGKKDAEELRLEQGREVQLESTQWRRKLPLEILPELPEGLVGLPYGLPGMEYFEAEDPVVIKKTTS